MTAVRITHEAAVTTITLCRPEVRNAFNEEVIAELTQAFRQASADERVRCVVLAAEGPAFCAGADLNWMRRMADYTRDENLADASKHSVKNMPVLLAGGGFKHGQHLAFDENKNPPLSNLFVSMLQRMGVEAEAFASSTGRLAGLELA